MFAIALQITAIPTLFSEIAELRKELTYYNDQRAFLEYCIAQVEARLQWSSDPRRQAYRTEELLRSQRSLEVVRSVILRLAGRLAEVEAEIVGHSALFEPSFA